MGFTMRRTLTLACICVCSPAFAQQPALKVGAWEVTTSGGPLPRAVVAKECMTKADIAQFAAGPDKDDDADCKDSKPPVLTGKKWTTEKTCPDGRKVKAEFTADSAERVKGSVAISLPGQSKAMTVDIDAKWLSASCQGVK